MQHTLVLRIGYRRLPDGRAEPICDPSMNEILLVLWNEAATVLLETDQFLITATGDALTSDGRMRPRDLFMRLVCMAQKGRSFMERVAAEIRDHYPFTGIANEVVSRARPQLLTQLDQPFVVTEAPTFVEGSRISIEPPRVEFENGHLRVVVTGVSEDHSMRAWADGLIRERAHDAILERLLREGGTINA